MFKLVFDRDRIYLYPWYLAEQCLTEDIGKIFNKKIDKTILEFKEGHLYSYMDVEQFNDIGKFLFEKIRKDKKFYKIVEKNVLNTGEDLIRFCENLSKLNLKKSSNKQLAKIYNDYSKKLKIMRAWGWVPPLIDGIEVSFLSNYIQEKLRQSLKLINQEDKMAEYYSILSSSEKMSEVQVEEIERLELLKKIEMIDRNLIKLLKEDMNKAILEIKNKPDIYNMIKNHAKKFEWLTYAYVGPVMSEKDVINLMRNSIKQKDTIDTQINNIKNHYNILIQKKKEISNKIKLSDELKYLFEVSTFFMYLKDLRKGIYQKSYVAMDPILEEISKRIKLTLEEVKYLTQDEINEALIDAENFSEVAKQRTEYCVSITENGKTKVYQGKKAEEIIKRETITEQIDKEIKEFKGSIAYSGKAIGIAKIISIAKDIPKIKDGEILVSSSTNPDLILAMKKASAFITDMGGITSHAAIVSREMKKPCIVGTKIATKIIKDGDLIEVDADKGVVKILKRV